MFVVVFSYVKHKAKVNAVKIMLNHQNWILSKHPCPYLSYDCNRQTKRKLDNKYIFYVCLASLSDEK